MDQEESEGYREVKEGQGRFMRVEEGSCGSRRFLEG